MDAQFFRRSKKVNRAVEYTDSEAIIPAVKSEPEIRKPLPNRRPLTFEERETIIEQRKPRIEAIEESIVTERKTLLQLVTTYKTIGSGAADVVAKNSLIKDLMDKRAALAHPDKWIEELPGLTFKDVFESKRDTRKLGKKVMVYQIKRRVEPIESLYVDLGAAADRATQPSAAADTGIAASIASAASAAAATVGSISAAVTGTVPTATAATAEGRAASAAARGALIAQARSSRLKKSAPPS